jgi:hypothetical protein
MTAEYCTGSDVARRTVVNTDAQRVGDIGPDVAHQAVEIGKEPRLACAGRVEVCLNPAGVKRQYEKRRAEQDDRTTSYVAVGVHEIREIRSERHPAETMRDGTGERDVRHTPCKRAATTAKQPGH